MALMRFAKRPAQHLDMIRQQRQPPLRQIDGEEEAATRNEVAAVCGHDAIISRTLAMGFARAQPILRAVRARKIARSAEVVNFECSSSVCDAIAFLFVLQASDV